MKSNFVSLGDTNWLMSSKSPYTIKTSPNAKYIAFNFSKDDNSDFSDDEWNNFINGNLQLEQSSTATSFEEHLQSQITVNLPSDEFIGKLDETHKDELVAVYNQEEGKYHLILNKMIGRVVLNGSETISKNSTINTGFMIPYNTSSPFYNKIKIGLGLGISNYFINQGNTVTWTGKGIFGFNISGVFWVMHADDDINTIELFKNWLSTHNVEVYYALEVPYQVDLGSIDMLNTYEGVTNIFTDSDLLLNIQAKYYQNFETTIKNLKVNEQSLKQELSDIKSRLTILESKEV